jgi:succinate dehydrogenase / fumarate reductase membrane anchor subunit
MMRIAASSHPREGAWLWLAKVATGVLVFALLIIHLVVNHLVAEGGLLTYADVLAYYANPIIPLMEGAFLILVVTHALLGVRGIVLDVDPAPAVMRGVDILLCIAGTLSIGYGLWLLATLASRATTG